jgi:hypothetical protein
VPKKAENNSPNRAAEPLQRDTENTFEGDKKDPLQRYQKDDIKGKNSLKRKDPFQGERDEDQEMQARVGSQTIEVDDSDSATEQSTE